MAGTLADGRRGVTDAARPAPPHMAPKRRKFLRAVVARLLGRKL
jgi:hypothetical protein